MRRARSVFPVAVPGDEGPVVRFAQEVLGVVPADARFDQRTLARVRGFQLSHGLPSSGALDVDTLHALGWSETEQTPQPL